MEAQVRQYRWLEAVDKGAKFPYRLLRLVLQPLGKAHRARRVGIDEVDQLREPDEQHHQSLLGAVMQVLADPSTLPRVRSQSPRLDRAWLMRRPVRLLLVKFPSSEQRPFR